MRMIILTLAALSASIASVAAEDLSRFSLEKTADGYVRLDKSTGEMSICKEQAGQLVCRLAVDDRAALADQVSSMDRRLTAIEGRLGNLEKSGGRPIEDMPTDEEFEKTMGYMERFFRRFMGVVKELNDEENGPQKT